MLLGEETFIEVSAEQRQQLPFRLRDAFLARRFDEVLELLRWNPGFLKRDQLAYIRARCWMELGHSAPAVVFFDHASELEPTNPSYPSLALTALVRGGQTGEAERRASRYVKDEATHPRLLFHAAEVLFEAARRSGGEQAKSLYEDVINAVRAGLQHELVFKEASTLPSVVLSGRTYLALALVHLGRLDEARREFEVATQRHPRSAEAWTQRGLFEQRFSTMVAAKCYVEAIKLGSKHVWAYFELARIRLVAADYLGCIELCQLGIELTDRPELIATMLEWRAIAMHFQGASHEAVRQAFQMALAIDPLNPRLRENAERFERSAVVDSQGLMPPHNLDFEISPEAASDEILLALGGSPATIIPMPGLAPTG